MQIHFCNKVNSRIQCHSPKYCHYFKEGHFLVLTICEFFLENKSVEITFPKCSVLADPFHVSLSNQAWLGFC